MNGPAKALEVVAARRAFWLATGRLRVIGVGALAAAATAAVLVTGPAPAITAAAPSMTTTAPAVTATAEPAIAPFSAHYEADWKSISVGSSDLELKPDGGENRYLYTWTITARGIFRMIYRDAVTQRSWLSVVAGHVRPDKYRARDGDSTVSLDFDWSSHQARGSSENKPVDLPLAEGTQDLMSIQVEVMRGLKAGGLSTVFQILEKDQVKEFNYTREGSAKIRTAIGELDTVIVASQRAGNPRILRMWFAPSLGYVPVQAERTKDGKLEFAMRIKSLDRP